MSAANSQAQVTENDAADAALAYAIWDSENTVRMKAECIQEHISRAQSVRHWLRIHGHDVRSLSSPAADRRQIVEALTKAIGAIPASGDMLKEIARIASEVILSPAPAQTEE